MKSVVTPVIISGGESADYQAVAHKLLQASEFQFSIMHYKSEKVQ